MGAEDRYLGDQDGDMNGVTGGELPQVPHAFAAGRNAVDALCGHNFAMRSALIGLAQRRGEQVYPTLIQVRDLCQQNGIKDMSPFVRLLNLYGYKACKTLSALVHVYRNDQRRLEFVAAQVAKVAATANADETMDLLAKATDIYGTNLKALGDVTDMIVNKMSLIRCLGRAKHLYGPSKIAMQSVIDVFNQLGGDANLFNRTVDACGGSIEIFRYVGNIGRIHGREAMIDMCKVLEKYGYRSPAFSAYERMIHHYGHQGALVLQECEPACKDTPSRRQVFVSVYEKYGEKATKFLASLEPMYRGSVKTFADVQVEIFTIMDKYDERGLKRLQEARSVYGDDFYTFAAFSDGMYECGPAFVDLLEGASFVYGRDKGKFRIFNEGLRALGRVCGVAGFNAAVAMKSYFGNDQRKLEESLKVVEDVASSGGSEACETLKAAAVIFGRDSNKLKFVKDLICEAKYETCRVLADIQGVNNFSIEQLGVAVKYLPQVCHEPYVLGNFIRIYRNFGIDRAEAYVAGLKKKAIGLIGSEPPQALRDDPAYMFYVKYVFPKGNYSSYELNLSCGDRTEDLDVYSYRKEGYPVKLSGVIGYRLEEGAVENEELARAYDQRMDRVGDFIKKRSPRDPQLIASFESYVDDLFEKKVDPAFKELDGLNTVEKLIALFLSEAVRKSKRPADFRPDIEILDTAVLHQYVYRQNFHHHEQRVSREFKAYGSSISRHFAIWRELSVVYGENLKQVLTHDIWSVLNNISDNKAKMEEVFEGLMGQEKEKTKLADKQVANIRMTFANEHIPEANRPDALKKQVVSIFGKNLSFEDEAQEQEYKNGLIKIVDEFVAAGNFVADAFVTDIVPKLFAYRRKFRLGIYPKLESMFMHDIKAINTEINKYNEVKDVEMKEKEIGGPRDTRVEKRAKTRNISGYFTKTAETANARMGAYACIAGDTQMWDNPDYFEFVMKDEDTGECCGLSMLMAVTDEEGRRYLFFCPNPFESFLDQVSSRQCYRYMATTVCDFAQENGFDGVFVPADEYMILGWCTNRGGDFPGLIKASRLKRNGQIRVVNLGRKFVFGRHGKIEYSYEDGALIYDAMQPKNRRF